MNSSDRAGIIQLYRFDELCLACGYVFFRKSDDETNRTRQCHVSVLFRDDGEISIRPELPLRNEEMYIAVLEYLTESSSLSDVEKIRPAHLLELALKNRIGTPATDFTYTLANGKTGKLYNIKADYLLLFFYNPDCHACQEITRQMESSFLINEFSKSNKTKDLSRLSGRGSGRHGKSMVSVNA